MNANIFFQSKRLLQHALLLLSVGSFNVALAGDISDAMILRAAKIAGDTGTTITLTRETTTVKVSGNSKKAIKTTTKTVVTVPKKTKKKSKKTKTVKLTKSKHRKASRARKVPALESSPPALNNQPVRSYSPTPVQPSVPVKTPTLDNGNSGFY